MIAFNRSTIYGPALVLLAAIAGTYLAARNAESNLNQTRLREQTIARRQSLLSQFMLTVVNAETGQRGYLITGDDSFLDPYTRAVTERIAVQENLRRSYLDSALAESLVPELQRLVALRFKQLAEVIKLRDNGVAAAASYLRNKTGKQTMDQLRATVDQLLQADQETMTALRSGERADVATLQVTTISGAMLSAVLVLIATFMHYRDLEQRAREQRQLESDKALLAAEVRARTAELSELSSHLQEVTERERSQLSRELHDELGGMLIAAKMDMAWLQKHPGDSPDAHSRWERLRSMLDAGVDLKRRIVEQLRPSLLDTLGLFAALRWQLAESCGRAGLECCEDLPEEELRLNSDAAIALFRIAQESMTNILKHAHATRVSLTVAIDATSLTMIIADNGRGMQLPLRTGSHGLMGMRHRVETLSGSWEIGRGAGGQGTELRVRVSLSAILDETEAT
jgi:signal transduction histidine kinase